MAEQLSREQIEQLRAHCAEGGSFDSSSWDRRPFWQAAVALCDMALRAAQPVSEERIDDLVESARLLGVTQAKKGFSCYTEDDARFERAMNQSIAKHRASIREALSHPQTVSEEGGQVVSETVKINPSHEAADAFWGHWKEVGETHRHGYYEATWGAINAALKVAGICAHPPRQDSGMMQAEAVPVAWIRAIRGSNGPEMPDEYDEHIVTTDPHDERYTALYAFSPTFAQAIEMCAAMLVQRARNVGERRAQIELLDQAAAIRRLAPQPGMVMVPKALIDSALRHADFKRVRECKPEAAIYGGIIESMRDDLQAMLDAQGGA